MPTIRPMRSFRRVAAGLSMSIVLAIAGGAPAAAGVYDEALGALREHADELVGDLREIGEEFLVGVAVDFGFEGACDAVGDAPFLRDACVALVGHERIDADVEGLIDEFLVRPDLDAISARLDEVPDEGEPGRAEALSTLYDGLSSDVEFLFDTLDQLDAVIVDRNFVLTNIRLLEASTARPLLPDAITSTLDALPLEDMEEDLVLWQVIRDEVAGTLNSLEDLRLLIDVERQALGGAAREEGVIVRDWAIVEIVQVREIAAMCGRTPEESVEVTIQDTVIYEALAPHTRAQDKVDRELATPRSKTWTTPSACGAERWSTFEAGITESGLTAEEARAFIKAFENDPGLFAPGSGPLKVTLGAGSSRMEKAGVIWAEASGQQYDGGIERGSVSADGAVQAGGGRLAAIFPTELGDGPWDELTIKVGQEIYASRDPVAAEDDPFTALLEATGASIDDVTAAVGSVETEDGVFAYVTAIQVVGVDAERVWESIFQPSMDESLIQPREEGGQVGGKDVRILWDDDCPECRPGHVYLSGDTAWVIIAVEPLLTEVFERLP